MLSGTETSLTYEININFTNKPQNLKLYIDENMQNELYVENNVLNLKEFLSLQDKKEVSKVIYWNWAEETGDTEDEIYENDLIDSEFMGKKLQMAISVTGRQAMSADNNYYMVTLDANGGKIGSSASVQKQVTCCESYGELPIPTREGYIFDGWYRPTYETYNYKIEFWKDTDYKANVLRLSPQKEYNNYNDIWKEGDILELDLTIEGTTIMDIDINDKYVNDSYYTNTGTNINGKIVLDNSMLHSNYYHFADINLNGEPTNYTINKFKFTQFDNQVIGESIYSYNQNSILYAKWIKDE